MRNGVVDASIKLDSSVRGTKTDGNTRRQAILKYTSRLSQVKTNELYKFQLERVQEFDGYQPAG